MCVSVAEHHTAEQYFQNGQDKTLKKASLKEQWVIKFSPILWEAALETKLRCVSKFRNWNQMPLQIYQGQQYFSAQFSQNIVN